MTLFKDDSDYLNFTLTYPDMVNDGYIWKDTEGIWLKESQMSSDYIKQIIKACREYNTTFTKLLLVGLFKELLHRRRKKIRRQKKERKQV